ncbi:Protein CBG10704 [Caenorhabditis briggsae]|uniref:Protein CBG10704 n=1 Tax=Caenorhabditis briggsae TaxID=6238 RepID=A8XBL6_CAEBR|nr:Protein CBG10704 [Caenorhabditis briggsae]CAP30032.1 Protein CBG10704 [Caenorhabditis briggsae]
MIFWFKRHFDEAKLILSLVEIKFSLSGVVLLEVLRDLVKRIVKVWGQMEGSKGRIFENYEECLSKCLGDATCVLIAETSSGCVNFNFANVPIVEKSNAYSGIKIGFKRSLDKCPSKTANSPLFGQTTITESYTSEGILYNYNITEFKSGSSTKWVFKPPTICPKDSIKLTRGKIDVCVSFRFFPDSKKCQNQAMGVKLCQDSGDSGLTGPFSDKERELFGNKLSTYQSDYTHQNFWIDGKRVDGSSSYTFSDSSLSSTNGYGSVRGANDACHFLATKGNLIGVVHTQSIGVRDSVTAETFTVCTGHTTSERSSTDRKNEKKKKTTKINFSIGWSFNGRKEGERQRKDGVQRARRQNV